MAIYVGSETEANRIYNVTGNSDIDVIVACDPNLNPSGNEGSHWFIPWNKTNCWCVNTCSADTTWYDALNYSYGGVTGLATSVQCTSTTGCVGEGWETLAQRYGKAISGFPALTSDCEFICYPNTINMCICHNSHQSYPSDCSITDCGFADYVYVCGCRCGCAATYCSHLCVPATRFTFQICNNCFKFMATAPVYTRELTSNCWRTSGNVALASMIGSCCPGVPERACVRINTQYGINGMPISSCTGAKSVYMANSSCIRFVYDFNGGNCFCTKCGYVKITNNYHGYGEVNAVLFKSGCDPSDNCVWYYTLGCETWCSCAYSFGPSYIYTTSNTNSGRSIITSGRNGRTKDYTNAISSVNGYSKNDWQRTCLWNDSSAYGTGYLLTYVSPWIQTNWASNQLNYCSVQEILRTISQSGGMWWYNSTCAYITEYVCSTNTAPAGAVNGCTCTKQDVCFSWNCTSCCLYLAHPYKIICGCTHAVR